VQKGNKEPKIFLYSAHEITVAAALFALNVWQPKVPEYSSAVMIELWEHESRFFIKVINASNILINLHHSILNTLIISIILNRI
jgi:hypothetical protein